MRYFFFQFICIVALSPAHLSADVLTQAHPYPQCTRDELMMFFPEPIVKKVLVRAGIPENEAEKIAKDLAVKEKEMAKIVDEKASHYTPNPFKDLSQRDRAIQIYQETLFEVFAGILKNYGINDENQMHTLLEEVRTIKSKMFIDCIKAA